MSKNNLKNTISSSAFNTFANKAAEMAIPEPPIAVEFENYVSGEALNIEDDEDETSVLLSQFLIQAIEVEYPLATDCLDMVIDHDEELDCYFALIGPRTGLSEQERTYSLKICRDFFSEIEMMGLDSNRIAFNPDHSAIYFQNKMTLLSLVVDYLAEKGIYTINLMDASYFIPEDEDLDEALKERIEKIGAAAERGTELIQANEQYIHELVLSAVMHPYLDMNNFKGTSQILRDHFARISKDVGKGALSIDFSNGRTLIAEKIRLENRGNAKLENSVGLPGYFIN